MMQGEGGREKAGAHFFILHIYIHLLRNIEHSYKVFIHAFIQAYTLHSFILRIVVAIDYPELQNQQ